MRYKRQRDEIIRADIKSPFISGTAHIKYDIILSIIGLVTTISMD